MANDSERGYTVCACMGPMYGEPHCHCEMVAKGLPLNDTDREASEVAPKMAMNRVFAKNRETQPDAGAPPVLPVPDAARPEVHPLRCVVASS